MSIDGGFSGYPHHLNNQEYQSPVYSTHPRNTYHLTRSASSGHETQILFLIIATGTIVILFILIIIICVKKNKYLHSQGSDQVNQDFDNLNVLTPNEITIHNNKSSLGRKNKISGSGKKNNKNGFFKGNEVKSEPNFTVPTIVITTASLKRKNYKDDEFNF
uniref:Uncharacterized protein n=1 Tax=Strongyloides venezuelensis TaxID=75913 RepID=A0A0K0FFS1_STRVS